MATATPVKTSDNISKLAEIQARKAQILAEEAELLQVTRDLDIQVIFELIQRHDFKATDIFPPKNKSYEIPKMRTYVNPLDKSEFFYKKGRKPNWLIDYLTQHNGDFTAIIK